MLGGDVRFRIRTRNYTAESATQRMTSSIIPDCRALLLIFDILPQSESIHLHFLWRNYSEQAQPPCQRVAVEFRKF